VISKSPHLNFQKGANLILERLEKLDLLFFYFHFKMDQPSAKRPRNEDSGENEDCGENDEFFLPKDKKLKKKCTDVLKEFEDWDITGFKFNYDTHDRLKGRAKCLSTACKNKHEPFLCEGGGVKASKDKRKTEKTFFCNY